MAYSAKSLSTNVCKQLYLWMEHIDIADTEDAYSDTPPKVRYLGHSHWLSGSNWSIYFRKIMTYDSGDFKLMLVLSNITISEKYQNKGCLSRILDWIESEKPYTGLKMENILVPELMNHMLRRGYAVSKTCCQSVYKLW